MLAKTAEIAAFPARLVWFLPVDAAAGVVSSALCAFAFIVMVIRREGRLLALLVLPWYVVLVFNVLGLWPYGVFRTNLFLLFYSLTLVCYALDISLRFIQSRADFMRLPFVFVLVVLFVIVLPLDSGALRDKGASGFARSSYVQTAMQDLYTRVAINGEDRHLTLVLDGHACTVFRYYLDYHESGLGSDARQWFRESVSIKCKPFLEDNYLRALREHAGEVFWIIVDKPPLIALTITELQNLCDFHIRHNYDDHTLLGECAQGRPLES